MASKKGKSKIMDSVLTVVKLAGGGFIANQVSNFVENQSFASSFKDYVPAVPLAVGVAGAMFAPEGLKPVAYGMIAVSGTELIEGIVNKATTTAPNTTASTTTGASVQGLPKSSRLGYTPQIIPEGGKITKFKGVAVR